MVTSLFDGLVIKHVFLGLGESSIVSRARSDDFDVTLIVKREVKNRYKTIILSTIHRKIDERCVSIALDPREVKLLHEQTKLRQVVGLFVPHLASTMLIWIRDGLYEPFVIKVTA